MSLKTQVKIALFQCDHIAHTNVGNRMVLLRLEVGHIAVFLIKVVVLHERFVQAIQIAAFAHDPLYRSRH